MPVPRQSPAPDFTRLRRSLMLEGPPEGEGNKLRLLRIPPGREVGDNLLACGRTVAPASRRNYTDFLTLPPGDGP